MQLIVITPKGRERRVDMVCMAWKEGLEASSPKLFSGYSGAKRGNSLTKDTDSEPLTSYPEKRTALEGDFRPAVHVREETMCSWDKSIEYTK